MEILLVVGAMVLVGLLMGFIAGLIWKDDRPIRCQRRLCLAVISAVVMGLIDWQIISAMEFSDTMKWLGIIFEPALGALFVFQLIRVAKKNR